ncbi:MAG: hypothetical protein LBR11_07100 [Deltaproteobacteria bacterium]|jgi:flagellar biosynthesis/type III secretory pathway protein FliH|nr:hypothetical protein [Deltaproteobacteria bacterium]
MPLIKQAMALKELFAQNPEERRLYELREKDRMSYLSELKSSRKRGMARGYKLGEADGIEKGIELGIEQGLELGLEQGREQGLELGREQGREQGLELGREQGLELGREQGIKRTALSMKAEGLSFETISKVTGLSIEEIRNL